MAPLGAAPDLPPPPWDFCQRNQRWRGTTNDPLCAEDNHPLILSLVQKEWGKLEYYRRSYYCCHQPHHLDCRNLRTDQHNNIAVSSHCSHGVNNPTNNPINSQILPRHHNPPPSQPWFVHLNHLEPKLATGPQPRREEPAQISIIVISLPQRSQHRVNNTIKINVTDHDRQLQLKFCRVMNNPRKHWVCKVISNTNKMRNRKNKKVIGRTASIPSGLENYWIGFYLSENQLCDQRWTFQFVNSALRSIKYESCYYWLHQDKHWQTHEPDSYKISSRDW